MRDITSRVLLVVSREVLDSLPLPDDIEMTAQWHCINSGLEDEYVVRMVITRFHIYFGRSLTL